MSAATHGNAGTHQMLPNSDVRTSNMELQIKWGHPRVYGAIATSLFLLFACISATTYFMDLTRSGFAYALLFILSTALIVPSLVVTVVGAMELKKHRESALDDVA